MLLHSQQKWTCFILLSYSSIIWCVKVYQQQNNLASHMSIQFYTWHSCCCTFSVENAVYAQPHNLSHNILLTYCKVWYLSLMSIAGFTRTLLTTWTTSVAIKSRPLYSMKLGSCYCCQECLQNQILPNPHWWLFFKNLRYILSDLNNLGQFSTPKTMSISQISNENLF